MARVFVSYRRADGVAWVGWLAERLRRLDQVDDVQTAFHDDQLRAGDDFPNALEIEIESCDLVIALIGEHWYGTRPDGQARIEDEDDWVVRELSTSLRQHKRVLPVLVSGQHHPLASELHPSIGELGRMHSVPFNDGADLDQIESHITSHLEEIDRERARLAGLDEPVTVPPIPQPLGTAVVASVAAIAGGLQATLVLFTAPTVFDEGESAGLFVALEVARASVAAAVAVVAVGLIRRISSVAVFRWTFVAMASLPALIFVPLASLNFVNNPSEFAFQFWFQITLFMLLLIPPSLVVMAVGISDPLACGPDLAGRARHVRTLWLSKREGMMLVAIAAAVAMAAHVSVNWRSDELDLSRFSFLQTMSLPVLVSGFVLGVHLWSNAKLTTEESALDRELRALPAAYRENARIGAQHRPYDRALTSLSIALPFLAGLIPSLFIVAT